MAVLETKAAEGNAGLLQDGQGIEFQQTPQLSADARMLLVPVSDWSRADVYGTGALRGCQGAAACKVLCSPSAPV